MASAVTLSVINVAGVADVAGGSAITFTTPDTTNGNRLVADGRTCLMVKAGAAGTVTVYGVPSGRQGRKSNVLMSVASGDTWVFLVPPTGFTAPANDADNPGFVKVLAQPSTVLIAAVRLPNV